MSTSALLTTKIPATLEDPEVHIHLRHNNNGTATLTARSPIDGEWWTVAATTAPVNTFRAALVATNDGVHLAHLQAGTLTVPLTRDMLDTILGWTLA